MTDEILQKITNQLVEGKTEEVVSLTQQALTAGLEPMDILQKSLVPGMNIVGQKFSDGEFFLPNLIVSANGMKKAVALLEPELRKRNQAVKTSGIVVIGTVRGDIHEIGKSLVATMLAVNGFQVHDLGVDVPVEKFVAKVKETGANLVGLSALLTTTMTIQREVIEALKQAGLRDRVKVLVGGAPVSRTWADEIGADGFAEDAMGAVYIARQFTA